MSTTTSKAHIAYELMDKTNPSVVVVGFVSRDISSPIHERELGEQLDSLICPDLPLRFVLDFKCAEALGSTAFCEVAAFARRVRWWGGEVIACNLAPHLSLGAALSGLDSHVEFVADPRTAIRLAREAANHLAFAN